MMQVAGLLVAAVVGWVVGIGLNRLAGWLPGRCAARNPLKKCSEARPRAVFEGIGKQAVPTGESQDSPGSSVPALPGPSWRALALKGSTALVLAALWWRHGLSWALLPAVVTALFLLLVAAIDIDHRLVLNEMLAVAAGLALLNAATQGWVGLGRALLGGVLAFGLFALLALLQRGALGAGDVKLAGVLGLAFGYPGVLRALIWGVIVGGVVAALLLLTRRVHRRTMIPYAPFLAAGGILVLLS